MSSKAPSTMAANVRTEIPDFLQERCQGLPSREVVQRQVHYILKEHFPDSIFFDEVLKCIESLSEQELLQLKREEVRQTLAELFQRITDYRNEEKQKESQATYDWIVRDQQAMELFLDQFVPHDLDAVLKDKVKFEKSIMTEVNLKEFVRELAINCAEFGQLAKYIERMSDWEKNKEERSYRYIMSVLHRSVKQVCEHEQDGCIPLSTLLQACFECGRELQLHISDKDRYIPRALAKRIGIYERRVKVLNPEKCADQNDLDKEKIASIDQQEESKRSTAVLGTVRRATDHIRTDLAPSLIQQGATAQEAFWAIHKAHFEKEPLLSHTFGKSLRAMHDYAREFGGEAFYQQSIGKIRKNAVSGSDHSHLAPRYLPFLEGKFFAEFEKGLQNVRSEEECLDIITMADMVLISAHFPFDGSGRMCEDFMVYVSQRLGFPLTISRAGYRERTSPLVGVRMKADDAYKRERDFLTLRTLGIYADPSIPRKEWQEYVRHELMEQFGNQGTFLFEAEEAREAMKLVYAMVNSEGARTVADRYQTFRILREIWKQARSQQYTKASDSVIAYACDVLMAESDRQYTIETQRKFADLEKQYPHDPLVHQVVEKHLHPTAVSDMVRLGNMLRESGEIDDAIHMYEETLKKDAHHFQALSGLGLALEKKGQMQDAEQCYRRAMVVNPEYDPAMTNLAALLMKMRSGEEEAKELLKRVIELNTSNFRAHVMLARLHMQQGQLMDAIPYLRRSLELRPNALDIRWELCELLKRVGSADEILEKYLDEVVESDPARVIAARFELAELNIRKNKPGKAESSLISILYFDPDNVRAHEMLGMLARTRRPYEAEELLRFAVENGTENSRVYMELASLLLARGNSDECKELCTHYVAKGFSTEDAQFEKVANAIGFVYERRKKPILNPEPGQKLGPNNV